MLVKRDFPLCLLSNKRQEMMGVCTIGVLACHFLLISDVSGILHSILLFGNVGVQGFAFLSGIGLFFSLKKKEKLSQWYLKRAKRVLIPYFISATVLYILTDLLHKCDIKAFFCDLLFISYWTHHKGIWFVAAIIPIYIIAPLYFHLYNSTKNKELFTFIVLFLITIISLGNIDFDTVIGNIKWSIWKMAPFFIGIYVGDLIDKNIKINAFFLSLLSIALFIVLSFVPVIGTISWWWILLCPLFLILCIFLDYNQTKPIGLVLKKIGSISLETYLINAVIIDTFLYYSKIIDFHYSNLIAIFIYLLMVIVGFVFANLLHGLCGKIAYS